MDYAMLGDKCDWGYYTTRGLSVWCVLERGHGGPHLDPYDRHWISESEHGPVKLVTP
jgi:hypothetical protein